MYKSITHVFVHKNACNESHKEVLWKEEAYLTNNSLNTVFVTNTLLVFYATQDKPTIKSVIRSTIL